MKCIVRPGLVCLLCTFAIASTPGVRAADPATDKSEKPKTEAAASETSAATVGTADAASYTGKVAVVTGTVAQVSSRPGITFLNFDKPYPDSPFTAIIRARNSNEFENVSDLNGKAVSVEGEVKEYRGKPEVELTKKSQLKILGETK